MMPQHGDLLAWRNRAFFLMLLSRVEHLGRDMGTDGQGRKSQQQHVDNRLQRIWLQSFIGHPLTKPARWQALGEPVHVGRTQTPG